MTTPAHADASDAAPPSTAPAADRARSVYGLVLAVLLLQAALAIVVHLGWRVVGSLWPDFDILSLFRMQQLGSFALLVGFLAVIGLLWMRIGDRRQRLVGAAVILVTLQAGLLSLSLPEAWDETSVFGESPIGQAFDLLAVVLACAGDIVLFAGLSRRARARRLDPVFGGILAFVALRLAHVAITLFRAALPSSMRPELLLDPSVILGLTALQLALLAGSTALFGVLLVRLRGARPGELG